MMKIAVIGQGFVGKPLSDFLSEKHQVIRYSLEPQYVENKADVKDADITFVCVPTPSHKGHQSISHLLSALQVCSGVVVIRSTILPGTSAQLQEEFPDLIILHSPEFLREKHAVEDTRNPERNVIGGDKAIAHEVMKVLPQAKYEHIVSWETAEMIKYAANVFLTSKVVLANVFYDVSRATKADPEKVLEVLGQDPRIGSSHLKAIENGRGAGGACFPKDLNAFRTVIPQDEYLFQMLFSVLETTNKQLLLDSGKHVDILVDIFGAEIAKPSAKSSERGEVVEIRETRGRKAGRSRKGQSKLKR